VKKIYWILLAGFIFRLVLAFFIWHPDVNNHVDWGIRFWQYGASKFYLPETNIWSYTWPNQPPGTILMFAGIRKLYEFIFSILWFINIKIPVFPSIIITFAEERLYPALLKLPSILADLGIGLLIYKIINYQLVISNLKNKNRLAALGLILWLFNPVIWYNSAVWGQTDAVINFLALLAFYFLIINKRLTLSLIAITLCFYIKASLLIFLPVYLILLFKQRLKIYELVRALIVVLIIILIPTLLFSNGNPAVWLFNLYREKVFTNQLQLITANAFNLWTLLTGIDEKPQTLLLGPLSYQNWGLILFAIFSTPVLWFSLKKGEVYTVLWTLTIISFSSFMFLTNMHERYLYPLFPVLTILAVMDVKLLIVYIIVSVINLLNLYNFWWIPMIAPIFHFLSDHNRVATKLLSFVNVAAFSYVCFRFLRLLKSQKI